MQQQMTMVRGNWKGNFKNPQGGTVQKFLTALYGDCFGSKNGLGVDQQSENKYSFYVGSDCRRHLRM